MGSHIPQVLSTSTIYWAYGHLWGIPVMLTVFPHPPHCPESQDAQSICFSVCVPDRNPRNCSWCPEVQAAHKLNQHAGAARDLGRAEHCPERCFCQAHYNHQPHYHAEPQESAEGLVKDGCKSQRTRAGTLSLKRRTVLRGESAGPLLTRALAASRRLLAGVQV